MSKKHFIELADLLRATRPTADAEATTGRYVVTTGEAGRQWEAMRDALADLCQRQNANFKRDRWLSYIAGECGTNGGTVK